jgi:hypothetical protein
MSWYRPFQATFQGAAITLGSTVISCGLAIQVEASAHRLLFWCAPEKYANVEQAYGLEQSQLDSVRHLGAKRSATGPQTYKEVADPLSPSIYAHDSVISEEQFAAGEKVSYLTNSKCSSSSIQVRSRVDDLVHAPNDKSTLARPGIRGTDDIVRQEILASAMTA